MDLDLSKLPEKNFFTIEELASRWNVDSATVKHFMWEQHILRPAIKIGGSWVDCRLELIDMNNTERDRYITPKSRIIQLINSDTGEREVSDWIYIESSSDRISEVAKKNDWWPETEDRFMGVFGLDKPPSDDDFLMFSRFMFQNFNGETIFIDLNAIAEVDGEEVEADTRKNLTLGINSRSKFYVTKEERDRFERAYGMSKGVDVLSERPSEKQRNSYLRTINALASALIGGLTRRHTSDAQAVLAALATAGVSAPIGDRALADYLKESDRLSN